MMALVMYYFGLTLRKLDSSHINACIRDIEGSTVAVRARTHDSAKWVMSCPRPLPHRIGPSLFPLGVGHTSHSQKFASHYIPCLYV
jgi:hypothetical protein